MYYHSNCETKISCCCMEIRATSCYNLNLKNGLRLEILEILNLYTLYVALATMVSTFTIYPVYQVT